MGSGPRPSPEDRGSTEQPTHSPSDAVRDARGSLRPDPAFEALPADVLEGTLADRFEAIANRHPDRVAVRDRGTSLTYLELDRSANATAHALIELGRARYDRPVAVLAEQGRDLVVAILGVLKTGAPYVPIDVHDGGARSRRAIDHVDPTAIVADAASAGRARKLAGHRPVVIVPRGSGRAKAPARNDDPDSAALISQPLHRMTAFPVRVTWVPKNPVRKGLG